MKQRYDQLAMSLLAFTVVLLVWMGTFGPTNTTTWKDWQPLMAAMITLGGAGIVYRGATLAYKAAMAKVDHDRDVHETSIRRETRGLCLRLQFATLVLSYDAEEATRTFAWELNDNGTNSVDTIVLRTAIDIDDAWQKLDQFPQNIARDFSNLKVAMFDLQEAKTLLGSAPIQSKAFAAKGEPLADLRISLKQIAETSARLRVSLTDMAEALSQQ